MSDREVRELERAVKLREPGAKRKLEAMWLRLGRGWFGEEIASLARGMFYLRVASQRRVYEWTNGKHAIEMVYVPGTSEATCQLCTRVYPGASFEANGRNIDCPNCDGTSVREVTPFYIGRFPVLYRDLSPARMFRPSRNLSFDRPNLIESEVHPVTMVTHTFAKRFCALTGLRLPHGEEWEVAGLGTWRWGLPRVTFDETLEGWRGRATAIRRQDRMHVTTYYAAETQDIALAGIQRMIADIRFYPWGWEPVTPTRDRCVSRVTESSGGLATISAALMMPATALVAEDTIDVKDPMGDTRRVDVSAVKQWVNYQPARPKGASWCGAMDMVGNVWQFLSDGACVGGSFRTPPVLEPGGRDDQPAGDELGFRVALDGAFAQ